MKTKFSILLTVVFTLMLSCVNNPDTPPEPTQQPPKDHNKGEQDTLDLGLRSDTIRAPHYILSFVRPKSFTANISKDKSDIWIYYDAENYCGYSNATDQTQYAALCERYDDTAYDQERVFPSATDWGFSYLTENIVLINVVTETAYNEQYPAGSSLNAICVLDGQSPYKHIKSGYTETYDWGEGKYSDKGSIPFSKPMTECTAEDMILMGDGYNSFCRIKLTERPKEGTTQLLTITLTDETGRVYTITTAPFTW